MDGASPAAAQPAAAPAVHPNRPPLWVLHLGAQPYRRALELQEQLVAARLGGTCRTCCCCSNTHR